MDRSHRLAEFLRARREMIKPVDVGIPGAERRRVPGLRREELAMLAGLSADYYMRLEQGRDHHPSSQVLAALAKALQLNDDATAYLFTLGRPPAHEAHSHRAAARGVAPELQDLLDTWTTTGAFVHGRRLDVLAANALARALTPVAEPGTNMLRSFFLDLNSRGRYHNLELVLATAVAYFRANVGGDLDDPGVKNLIDELSLRSDEFRQVWARHDVQSALFGEDPYIHPTIGALRLRYHTFALRGSDEQTLFVISAAPGSHDAQALALLASSTADLGTPGPAPGAERPLGTAPLP